MKTFFKDFFSTLGAFVLISVIFHNYNPRDFLQNYIDQNIADTKLEKTGGNTYIYHFNEPIRENNYNDLILFLQMAKPQDKLVIEINSPGGSVDTTFKVVEAMQQSNASVSCKAGDWVASGAAIILLQCGKIELQPNTLILFHLPYFPVGEFQVRDAPTNEYYLQYVEQNFCLRSAMGEGLFNKMTMGYNVVYKASSFKPIMTNGCRIINHDFMVIGHE